MSNSLTRRSFLKATGSSLLCLGGAGLAAGFKGNAKKRMNVLFIAVDDLRPQLNCYGSKQMITPNIDRIASEGVIFSKSYCQVPVCGASRASLFTGIRPSRDRFVTYYTYAEKDTPKAVTMGEHFKKNGYHSIANGKVFHHADDSTQSWTEPHFEPDGHWRDYLLAENIELQNIKSGPAYECADVGDSAYKDGRMVDKTIEDLKRLSKSDKPFFLAAGLVKPHLPFNAPKKYWDMYPLDKIDLADNPFRPKDAPEAAFHGWHELRGYFGIPKKEEMPDDLARKLIQGYYASTTYADAQIGRLLDALEELGLKDNTAIVLLGDHGWNLGEHTLWAKHCNFNTSLRTPLMFSAPGMQKNKKSDSLAEFIDVYPTLCDLAGLDKPDQLHGKSLVPILKNPEAKVKDAVFSRYHDGESVRTERYLYTEWINDEGERHARMLYDHKNDPAENVNIAEKPENKTLVKELSKKLEKVRRQFK